MNRSTAYALAAATLILASVACAKRGGTKTGSAGAIAADSLTASHVEGRPVITRLVGRDQVVTITSSPQGPRYSAATTAGAVIVSGATLDQLRAEHPDVYRFVYPARASKAGDGADRPRAEPQPWAGADQPDVESRPAYAPQPQERFSPAQIDASRPRQ